MARLAAVSSSSSSSSKGDVSTSTSQIDTGKSARPPLLFLPKYLMRSKTKKRQHVRPTQSRVEKSSMKEIHKPRTSEFTYFKQRRLNYNTSAPVATRTERQHLEESDAQTPPGYSQQPSPLRSAESEKSESMFSEDLKDDPVSCGNYKDNFEHLRKQLQLLASKNSISSRPIDIEMLLSRLEVVHTKPRENFEKDIHDQVSTFTEIADRFQTRKPDLLDSFPLNTREDSLLLSRQDSDICELGMLSPFIKITPGVSVGAMMDSFKETGGVWDTNSSLFSARYTELELDFDRCSPREALEEYIDFERQDEQRQQEPAGHAVEHFTNSYNVSSPGFLDEEWLYSEADYGFQRSQDYISPVTTILSSESGYSFQRSHAEQTSHRQQEPAGHEYLTNSYSVSSPGFLDEEWLSNEADYYFQRSQHYVSSATQRDLQRSQQYISTMTSHSPGRSDFGQRSSPEAFGIEEDIKTLNLKFGLKKNFPERKSTFYSDSCDAAVSWQNEYNW